MLAAVTGMTISRGGGAATPDDAADAPRRIVDPADPPSPPIEGTEEAGEPSFDDGLSHWIVEVDDPAALAELESLPGAQVVRIDGSTYAVAARGGEQAIRSVPGVSAVDEDVALGLADMPADDPMLASQWGLENRGDSYLVRRGDMAAGADTHAFPAWRSSRGRGVVIAVVDTGVDLSHPDLRDRAWNNSDEVCGNRADDDRNGFVDDCQGWDFARNDASVYDRGDHWHGTHVGGIAAATLGNSQGGAGIAPEASIMAVKISSDGQGIPSGVAAAAINYAVDNGADVVNCSWGGQGHGQPAVIGRAIERAEAAGVLVVAAAGNWGVDIDRLRFWPAASTASNVVSVGASDALDRRAFFSNYGAQNVDLFAPGYMIYSTFPGATYRAASGTSMAAPFVSGAAALLLSADPSLDAAAVAERLRAGADRIGGLSGLAVSGGRLSATGTVGSSGQPVAFRFVHFSGASPDAQQTEVVATVAGGAGRPAGVSADTPLAYRVHLGARVDGQLWAVTEEEIGYVLPDGSTARAATGSDGSATLAGDGAGFRAGSLPGGSLSGTSLELATALPEGEYAFAVELVNLATGAAVTQPQAIAFTIGSPAGPGDGTTPTTAPPSESPTTTGPASPTSPGTSETTLPDGSTSPTTEPVTGGTVPSTDPVTGATTTVAPAPVLPTVPGEGTDPGGEPPSTDPGGPEPQDPPATPPEPSPEPTDPAEPPATSPLPEIPATPTGLAGTADASAAVLAWDAVDGAAGYRVWRDGDLAGQTTGAGLRVEGLEPGGSYAFSVSAYSTGGESARSGEVIVTIDSATPTSGSPAPGESPGGTSPGDTSPETTTPPETAPPVVTTTPPSDPGTFTVLPDHGTAAGGDTVLISGPGIDDTLRAVFFDGQPQSISWFMDGTVSLRTLPHQAGTVDVVMVAGDGTEMVIAGGFTFDAAPGETTTTTAADAVTPETAPETTSPPETAATTTPETAPPTVPVPTTPATSPPVTESPAPTAAPNPEPPAPSAGRLRLAPLTSTSPLARLTDATWPGATCSADPCSGISL